MPRCFHGGRRGAVGLATLTAVNARRVIPAVALDATEHAAPHTRS